MRILFITSSYRKKSTSTALARAAASAAESAGHDVTLVDISRARISPCRGCEACHKPGAKGCVVRDGMQDYYPLALAADCLVFASPVYWFNLCGQIKQFIDRCYAIALAPQPGAPSPFAAKRIGLILAYGGDDVLDSGGVNAIRSFQDICAFTGASFAGALYGLTLSPGGAEENAVLVARAEAFGAGL